MHGRSRPGWALPPTPPDAWGLRRSLYLGAAAAAVVLPVVGLPTEPTTYDVVRAVALTLAGLAGVALVVAASVVAAVWSDRRWADVAVAAAVLPLVTALRGATGPAPGTDAALALVQWSALPVGALLAGHAVARAAAGALAVLAVALALVPGAAGGLLDDRARTPLLAALELGLGLLAAAAAVQWLRRSPPDGPHPWVTAALVLIVVAAAARAVVQERQGTGWLVVLVSSTAAVVVPALWLSLVTLRPYRRQSRRWRQLETQVLALRASSPLLPGPSITPEDEDGLPTAEEVRAIVERGAVGIALQPVVLLADGTVVGQEALARFGGRVPTDRWFRGAGLHGMSEALELLTLRAALATLPRLADDVTLAVNLSPLALADPKVLAELQRTDLTRVVVEITEHEAVRDYAAARAHLDVLRAAGARVAVDDIGAGFASLRHALMLRPDLIKLDQSLTRGVDHDARQRGVVVALTRFAEEVGVELVAEGVETAEQATVLRELGLVVGQGWGLGVPVLQRDDAPLP